MRYAVLIYGAPDQFEGQYPGGGPRRHDYRSNRAGIREVDLDCTPLAPLTESPQLDLDFANQQSCLSRRSQAGSSWQVRLRLSGPISVSVATAHATVVE